ncbi:MAG: hypothetical protein A3F72_13315 [Bacteroidetes bacterium RIFCSPLOWO2_12_FULL_35_15]|nr:MAG: hypothetical protein A3F72_13315 [Bacteroidetes bacterium RIFCSPLOWO2_12_FULL_35_15]
MKLSKLLSMLSIMALFFVSSQIYGQVKPDESKTSSELIVYVCPMHPEIKSLSAGTCSKCGMNLEPKKANLAQSEQTKDSIYYTCSMHPEVKESKPGNCPKCGMTLIKKSINDKSSSGDMKMGCMGMGGMDMDQPKKKHPMRIAWIGMGALMVGMMTTMIVVIAGR